jgi:hypothetical protein
MDVLANLLATVATLANNQKSGLETRQMLADVSRGLLTIKHGVFTLNYSLYIYIFIYMLAVSVLAVYESPLFCAECHFQARVYIKTLANTIFANKEDAK